MAGEGSHLPDVDEETRKEVLKLFARVGQGEWSRGGMGHHDRACGLAVPR